MIGSRNINLELKPIRSSWGGSLDDTEYTAFEIPSIKRSKTVVGIDPGSRNMGVAILLNKKVVVYEIKYPEKLQTVAILDTTRKVLLHLLSEYTIDYACVEGAAHGKGFGQAKLSESKSAAVMALLDMSVQVIVAAPLSVYKEVFGSGKIKAKEYKPWNHIPKNSASALACAFYAERKL